MSQITPESSFSEFNSTFVENEDDENTLLGGRNVASVFRFGLFRKRKEVSSDEEQYIISTCSLCRKKYTHRNFANTTSLKYHLQKKHEKRLIFMAKKAQKDVQKGRKKRGDTILDTDLFKNLMAGDATIDEILHSTSPNSSRGSNVTQREKRDFFPEVFQELFTLHHVKHNIPFNTCDSAKEYLEYAREGLGKLVSRGQMSRAVAKIKLREVEKLKTKMEAHDGRFSLTLDEWTAGNRSKYLGITLHFFDENFILKNYTLGFEALVGRKKSAKLLMKSLSTVLKTYNINERIISITRDNAAVMTCLVNDFAKNYNQSARLPNFKGDIRCAGHVLNLCCTNMLHYTFFKKKDLPEFVISIDEIQSNNTHLKELYVSMRTLPGTVRKIVKGVQGVDLIRTMFTEHVEKRMLRENKTTGPKTLLLDNETRWLSVFNMIDRFLYFKEEVNDLLSDLDDLPKKDKDQLSLKVFKITEMEWEYLSNLQKILFVFKEPTLQLQASKTPTIHMTISYMHLLSKDLLALDTEDLEFENPWLSEALKQSHKKLESYYHISEGVCKEDLMSLYLATVLDPQLRLDFFRKIGFPTESITKIKTHFLAIYDRYKEEYVARGNKSSEIFPHEAIYTCRADLGGSRLRRDIYQIKENQSSIAINEVLVYLEEPTDKSKTLIEFYQSVKSSSPVLYRIAKDYLAIPAMSAPCESVFSQMGDAITKKRNQLSAKMVGDLAFLKSIEKLLGYERMPGSYELVGEESDGSGSSDDESVEEDVTDWEDMSEKAQGEISEDTDDSMSNCSKDSLNVDKQQADEIWGQTPMMMTTGSEEIQ